MGLSEGRPECFSICWEPSHHPLHGRSADLLSDHRHYDAMIFCQPVMDVKFMLAPFWEHGFGLHRKASSFAIQYDVPSTYILPRRTALFICQLACRPEEAAILWTECQPMRWVFCVNSAIFICICATLQSSRSCYRPKL